MAPKVVELRQYTLHPGQREALVALFDGSLVRPQEALGMTIIGQFRDVERPERFVWLRGFAGMDARQRALSSFYDGPDWAKHCEAANRTMAAFDDVLLLRPVVGFDLAKAAARPPSRWAAGIAALEPAALGGFTASFRREAMPRLAAIGVPVEAILITETARNTYPRLPVREGESVLVWFARLPAGTTPAEAWAPLAGWLEGRLARPLETLHLAPTAGSRLR